MAAVKVNMSVSSRLLNEPFIISLGNVREDPLFQVFLPSIFGHVTSPKTRQAGQALRNYRALKENVQMEAVNINRFSANRFSAAQSLTCLSHPS